MWLIVCLALIVSSLSAVQLAGEFAQADLVTRRLPPSAIRRLPAAVRRALERRGCTIPQLTYKGAPPNAVRGAFTAPGRKEWAVLCSGERVSSILVLREHSGALAADLARKPDVDFLQNAGPRWGIVFSREITAARPPYVRICNLNETERPGRLIDHDGIRDAFVDKASVAWYLERGQWRRFGCSD
jgi:hypothetical protein